MTDMMNHLAPDHMRFASYNIRKARGLDRRSDPRRILSVVNALGADVVALQEVDHRMGDRPSALDREMIAQETDFKVAPLARNQVSLGWHGNAVLVRKGQAIAGVSHLDIPGLEPRGAVGVKLSAPMDLNVVATHLGLIRFHRRRQIKAIVGKCDPQAPTIILGDFNEWSTRRGMEGFVGQFEVHTPGRSFHSARPMAPLDRVAVSRGVQVQSGGVFDSADARLASDHLPIWVDVIVSPQDAATLKTALARSPHSTSHGSPHQR